MLLATDALMDEDERGCGGRKAMDWDIIIWVSSSMSESGEGERERGLGGGWPYGGCWGSELTEETIEGITGFIMSSCCKSNIVISTPEKIIVLVSPVISFRRVAWG